MTRLLLVDDDTALRSMLAGLFGDSGYQVYQASDGNEALKIHRRHPVDVMVVELVLPGKDGYQLLMELRAQPFMPKFIAITDGWKFPMQDCLRTAKQMGAHAVVAKPFQPEHLLATVNQVLGKGDRDLPRSSGSGL